MIQLDYKVTFTLAHAGKYRTQDKLKIQTILKLNITLKSKQRKKSKTKLPWSSHLLRHLARKQCGQCSQVHITELSTDCEQS